MPSYRQGKWSSEWLRHLPRVTQEHWSWIWSYIWVQRPWSFQCIQRCLKYIHGISLHYKIAVTHYKRVRLVQWTNLHSPFYFPCHCIIRCKLPQTFSAKRQPGDRVNGKDPSLHTKVTLERGTEQVSPSHLTDGEAKAKWLAQDPVGTEPDCREKLSLLVLENSSAKYFQEVGGSAWELAFPPLISLGFLESFVYLALASASMPRRVQLAFI